MFEKRTDLKYFFFRRNKEIVFPGCLTEIICIIIVCLNNVS